MKLRTGVMAIWLAACVAPIPNPAAAAGRTSANRAVVSQSNQDMRAACRGPGWNGASDGLPSDPTGDIRCQAVASLSAFCAILAVATGTFRHEMQSGQFSFSQIKSSMDNGTPPASGADYSGLYLAENLPPDMRGGDLVRTVYAQCMSVVR